MDFQDETLLDDRARSWIGRELSRATVAVSRDDIRKYAIAVGAEDPVHHDPEAARVAGHPDIVAPPGFQHVIASRSMMLVPRERLGPDGVPFGLLPNLPLKRAMAGETELEFVADIHAGDAVSVRQVVARMEEKRGRSGPLILLTVDFEYTDAEGRTLVLERATRVLR